MCESEWFVVDPRGDDNTVEAASEVTGQSLVGIAHSSTGIVGYFIHDKADALVGYLNGFTVEDSDA